MEENKTIEQEAPVVEAPAVEETVAEAPAVEAAPAAETKKVLERHSQRKPLIDLATYACTDEFVSRIGRLP